MTEPLNATERLEAAIRDELYDVAFDRRALPSSLADLKPGLVVVDLERAAKRIASDLAARSTPTAPAGEWVGAIVSVPGYTGRRWRVLATDDGFAWLKDADAYGSPIQWTIKGLTLLSAAPASVGRVEEVAREALRVAQGIIDGVREELHQRRVADWHPEGAHSAAEQMSEDMRLIGNRLADVDLAALTKARAILSAEEGGSSCTDLSAHASSEAATVTPCDLDGAVERLRAWMERRCPSGGMAVPGRDGTPSITQDIRFVVDALEGLREGWSAAVRDFELAQERLHQLSAGVPSTTPSAILSASPVLSGGGMEASRDHALSDDGGDDSSLRSDATETGDR